MGKLTFEYSSFRDLCREHDNYVIISVFCLLSIFVSSFGLGFALNEGNMTDLIISSLVLGISVPMLLISMYFADQSDKELDFRGHDDLFVEGL